jgi:hypothetical protein
MARAISTAPIVVLCLLVWPGLVQSGDQVAVTVYNEDIGLVKELRAMSIPKGESDVEFKEVAARIDPTSVHFVSRTAPGTVTVLEQNYEYDLVSATKLLEKYIDNKVTVFTKDEKVFEGTLLSFDGQNLVLAPEGMKGPVTVVSQQNVRDINFPALPGGLITKPTLVWKLLSEKAGTHDVEVSYLTDGLNWHAEYVAVSDAKDESVRFTGWVSVDNRSGATYKDAKLKLVAGTIHRVRKPPVRALYAPTEGLTQAAQVIERPFFEYHLYSLERPTTIRNNQVKQISLFPETKANVRKIFTYDGKRYPNEVRITLELTNTEAEGLGMPLPEGKVRVYKEDIDKSIEFVGEDEIQHTPKGEQLRIYVGNAFDLVGERTELSMRQLTKTLREYTVEVKLRNHKEEPVEITAVETIWGDWKITSSSHPYVKKDARTVEFKVKVPKGGEVVISYTVQVGY